MHNRILLRKFHLPISKLKFYAYVFALDFFEDHPQNSVGVSESELHAGCPHTLMQGH